MWRQERSGRNWFVLVAGETVLCRGKRRVSEQELE